MKFLQLLEHLLSLVYRVMDRFSYARVYKNKSCKVAMIGLGGGGWGGVGWRLEVG